MLNIPKKKTTISLLSFLLSVILLTSIFTLGTFAYSDNASGVDMGACHAAVRFMGQHMTYNDSVNKR